MSFEPNKEYIERYEDHPAYAVISDNPSRRKGFLRFVFWSLIGILLFMTPIQWHGKTTILIGLLGDELGNAVGKNAIYYFTLFIVTLSFVGATLVKIWRPNLDHHPQLKFLFDPSWTWYIARAIGCVFIWMIFLKTGSKWVYDANTGGVILGDLMPALVPLWLFAFLLMPALTDYGLMEYIGTLLRKPFVIIFRLPGRSVIDAISSWFGAVSVGVMVTISQYDKGYYTEREASVIATTFSVASIAFTYVVAKTINIADQFIWFYATVVICGVLLAVIMPRIPPLSLKKSTYATGDGQLNEDLPANTSTHQWAITQAIYRAHRMPSAQHVFRTGFINLCDVYIGLVPAIFALGTIGLILTEYTPLFTWLAKPLVPYLELLQIPDAARAAPAILVGFADMFLPALVGKSIETEMTRFVIGVCSIVQIIYMSEVGVLLLKSKIRINLLEIFIIFLLRILIALPIISLIAHWIYRT